MKLQHSTTEEKMREYRDLLLQVSDWTQVIDSPLDPATKTAWQLYRQALRDLSEHEDWPNVPIPTKPA